MPFPWDATEIGEGPFHFFACKKYREEEDVTTNAPPPFVEAAVRVGRVVIADVAARVSAAALLKDLGPLLTLLLEVTCLEEAMV